MFKTKLLIALVNIVTNLMSRLVAVMRLCPHCSCQRAVFYNKKRTELHGGAARIWNTFFWHLALPLKWILKEGGGVDYLPHTTLYFLLLKKKIIKTKPSYFYIRAATLCDALGVCMCVKPYLSYLGRVLMNILKLLLHCSVLWRQHSVLHAYREIAKKNQGRTYVTTAKLSNSLTSKLNFE